MPKLPLGPRSRQSARCWRPAAGFELLRSKGSHRIYGKGILRVTLPFHSGASLHPKIVTQVFEAIEDARQKASQDD